MRFIVYLTTLCLLSGISFFSCKGPEGPQGPAGTQGPAGIQGPTGPQGPAGSSNILQINYATRQHTGSQDLLLTFPASASLTTDVLEKSLLYVYVKQSGTNTGGQSQSYWFAVPGETVTGNEYSYYLFSGNSQANPGLFLRRVVNFKPGAESFDAIRVLIVPAGTTISGGRLAAGTPAYEVVKELYHLPD